MVPAARPTGRASLLAIVGAVLVACHTSRPTQPPLALGPFTADGAPEGAGPAVPPPPPNASVDPEDELECTTDAECVITNFSDCCACCACAKPPHAASHEKLHALEARCATADCSMEGCDPKRCPPCTTPTLTPACEDGTCVAR